MKKMKMWKLERDNFEFFIGKFTFVFYWPYIAIEKRRVHIAFHSQITYHDRRNWEVNKSFVIKILGFGFGIAHNHCYNSNYVEPKEKSNVNSR